MNAAPKRFARAAHLFLPCLMAAPCAAQQIIQPVAATTTLGGSGSVAVLIDQSGLTNPYIDGQTDFAAFVATTSHANSNAASLVRLFSAGRTITLDLGTPRDIDSIALWGLQTSATRLTRFALFADNDSNFANRTTSSLSTFLPSPCTACAQPDLSSLVGFTSVNRRGGIRLEVPPNLAGFRFTAWATDIDLVNASFPSSSGGLEFVIQ